MKKSYNEVNYCVYLKNGDDNFTLLKKSIIYQEKTNTPTHEPINDVEVFNIFTKLFPILNKIPKNIITIHKAWETSHPLSPDEEIPTNEYDDNGHKIITRRYNEWLNKPENKNILKVEDHKSLITDKPFLFYYTPWKLEPHRYILIYGKNEEEARIKGVKILNNTIKPSDLISCTHF